MTGDREVLGIDVGDSEDDTFWTAFCKGLRDRGLSGVQLVISGHHLCLEEAIGAVFVGASWQRCRVHFMLGVSLGSTGAARQVVYGPASQQAMALFNGPVSLLRSGRRRGRARRARVR